MTADLVIRTHYLGEGQTPYHIDYRVTRDEAPVFLTVILRKGARTFEVFPAESVWNVHMKITTDLPIAPTKRRRWWRS